MVSTTLLPNSCFRSALAHALNPSLLAKNVADPWLSEACVRGHRATRCDHFDRWMARVKKPGRPLRGCPHATGPCTCNGEWVIMMMVPERYEGQTLLLPRGERFSRLFNGRTTWNQS